MHSYANVHFPKHQTFTQGIPDSQQCCSIITVTSQNKVIYLFVHTQWKRPQRNWLKFLHFKLGFISLSPTALIMSGVSKAGWTNRSLMEDAGECEGSTLCWVARVALRTWTLCLREEEKPESVSLCIQRCTSTKLLGRVMQPCTGSIPACDIHMHVRDKQTHTRLLHWLSPAQLRESLMLINGSH